MSWYKYKFDSLPLLNKKNIKMLHAVAGMCVHRISDIASHKTIVDALSEVGKQTLSLLNKCMRLTNELLLQLLLLMQKLWGFLQDVKKHTWWLKSGWCTCPKLDNTDPLYFGGGKIIDGSCPVHGILVYPPLEHTK